MTRYLKMLGLAAMAMALSAVFASAASAQNGIFTSGETGLTPTDAGTHTASVFHAVQEGSITDNRFEAFGNKFHCDNEETEFNGETTGTDTVILASANYRHCYTFSGENHTPGLAVTVTMNTCGFAFGQPTHIENHTTWQGTASVVCGEEGDAIEVEAYFMGSGETTGEEVTNHGALRLCNDKIGEQAGLGPVVYHNEDGDPDDLTVTVGIEEEIEASQEGLCGASSTNVASYFSNLTVTSSEGDDLWISTE